MTSQKSEGMSGEKWIQVTGDSENRYHKMHKFLISEMFGVW